MKSKQVVAFLLIVFLYVIGGKAALMLALPPGYASAIFPPAGIAVAAAFIRGRSTLPAVLAGAFLLNAWVGYTADGQLESAELAAAAVIAVASVLQAALGGWLLRRVIGYPAALDNARAVFAFLLLAPAICLVSATLSVAGLRLAGILDAADLGRSWLSWWIGDTLGVMVMLPIALAFFGKPRALWKARRKTVVLPMLLSLALFVAMFVKTSQWEQDNSLEELRQVSRQSLNQIQTQLGEQSAMAIEMSGLFVHDPQHALTREDFRRIAQVILPHFPTIQALEWAPRIRAADRAAFEAALRRETKGSGIKERDAQGALLPAGAREEYYPVTYVEPLAGNEAALGYDLASNPLRREALLKTDATGEPVVTAPITLVQQRHQPAMLILQSVKRGERDAGVVVTVLKLHDFMEKILPPASAALELRLIDEDAREIVFDTFTQSAGAPPYERSFEFAARHFRLQTRPTAAYVKQHRGWQGWGVLAMGTFGTSLFGALLLLGTGYTARVVEQVNERTRELQESEARFRTMADSTPTFIWVADRDNRVQWFNQTLLSFAGITLQQALAGAWIERMHVEDRHCLDEFAQHAGRREPFQMEFRLKRGDGEYRWILDSGSPRFDQAGNFLGYIGSGVDITERKQAADMIRHMAQHDALTGLPNRALAVDRLQHALAEARRGHGLVALMFIDLDNFKPINDELGHHIGDLLLKEAAARMQLCVREADTVGRIGGDEFVAVLPGIKGEHDALQVAEKIRHALNQPFELEQRELRISSSIGIAVHPEHGAIDKELMRNADFAMYQVKRAGRNSVRMYDPALRTGEDGE